MDKQEATKKEYKLSDQLIGQLANLICVAMATQTNVVDHFRMIRVEESDQQGMDGKLVLTPSYVDVYNKQVKELTDLIESSDVQA
jgi:hypothetical protein